MLVGQFISVTKVPGKTPEPITPNVCVKVPDVVANVIIWLLLIASVVAETGIVVRFASAWLGLYNSID